MCVTRIHMCVCHTCVSHAFTCVQRRIRMWQDSFKNTTRLVWVGKQFCSIYDAHMWQFFLYIYVYEYVYMYICIHIYIFVRVYTNCLPTHHIRCTHVTVLLNIGRGSSVKVQQSFVCSVKGKHLSVCKLSNTQEFEYVTELPWSMYDSHLWHSSINMVISKYVQIRVT